MLVMRGQVNLGVFGVFLTLELTEIFLAIGNFTDGGTGGLSQFGGYLGIITAFVAWYASAAGLANGLNGKIRLPAGKPLIYPGSSHPPSPRAPLAPVPSAPVRP